MKRDGAPPPQFLALAEVAVELGVSRPFLRRLIVGGELLATRQDHRQGSPWLVERQVLEWWLNLRYAVTREWVEVNPRGGDGMWDRKTGRAVSMAKLRSPLVAN